MKPLLPLLLGISFLVLPLRADEPLVCWPDNISQYVRKNVGGPDTIGYTRAQMANFPGYSHRLGFVSRLFEDAEQLPHETNQLAQRMLEGSFEQSIEAGLRLLGAQLDAPGSAPTYQVRIEPADEAAAKIWNALPAQLHALVEQLVQSQVAARPLLHKSFDWDRLSRATGDANLRDLGTLQVFNYAAGPWLGSGRGSNVYQALNTFRSTPLGNAGVGVLSTVREVIDQLQQLDLSGVPDFDTCQLRTSAGNVTILGRGNNRYAGRDAVTLDLGGNDSYSGRLAVPVSKLVPVGLLIDLAGDDTYDGGNQGASLACGLFGIGALFDLAGNDKYSCDSSGMGCAWHGIGLLYDAAGNDIYRGRQWTQGAAHAGVGMLIDQSGDDQYYCQLESQGLGATLGVGVLVDKSGRDRYHAYDNENGRRITMPSSQTKSHEVSLSQGCGYGRRADELDGHHLAGGVGALIDGAGDDSYYGGVFSQGTGFWWSVGMLVDYGGNDSYRGVYYAQGAAAHFAIGSLVDHAGNDTYNDRGVLGQVLGAGRDGSIGAMLDVSGDDVYYIPKKSAGGGDMNAIGLLCDKQGDDQYYPTSSTYLGTASFSGMRGQYFRSTMPTLGLFVDLGGEDRYGSQGQHQNNSRWLHQSGPPSWGFGLDTAPREASDASASTQ